MGDNTPQDDNIINTNEETRIFGYTGSQWVRLSVDNNGEIEVNFSDDHIGIQGDDDDGNTLNVGAETLSETITDPDGLITYLSRALQQYGDDQVRVDLENDNLSSNLDVDIAEQTLGQVATNLSQVGGTGQSGVDVANRINRLSDSLDNFSGADELRGLLFGYDSGATLQRVNAEQFDRGLGSGSVGLATYLARALQGISQDQVRVDLENDNLGSNLDVDIAEQTLGQVATNLSQIGGTGQSGVDVANQIDQLADALNQFAGTDELLVTTAGRDEVEDTNQNNDINASSYTNQFDVTAGMESVTVSVDDAGGSFHVEVRFQDGGGTTITVRDDNNSSAYSGDASTDVFVDTELAAPQVEVAVVDDSGAANEVDITLRAN
jgi:hypothetical protein